MPADSTVTPGSVAALPPQGPPSMAAPRTRSRRGHGAMLREDIINGASALLAETGSPVQLSLRAVAKRVGIATTSVYLHFEDIDHLVLAVADRFFFQLASVQNDAETGISDPLERLLARCRAYCRFALEHPGHYRLMFRAELAPGLALSFSEAPGRSSFESLVTAVGRCLHVEDGQPRADPRRLATAIWALEHGLVSLRLSRPRFPWPPIEELVSDSVRRLLRGR